MINKIISKLPFLLALSSFSLYAEEAFKCNSPYQLSIEDDNGTIQFDGRLTFVMNNNAKGSFSFNGRVKEKENIYLLSRNSFFTLVPHDVNHNRQAIITKVIKLPSDTTPDNIWQKYISPAIPGVAFNVEIWKLKQNIVLVKSPNSGYVMCAKE